MLDASKFTVEVGDDGFQLIGPGEVESGVAEFGDVAEVEVEGETYQCVMDDHEDAPQISLVLAGEPKVEDVDFELIGAEDGDGDGNVDEDGDEE